MQEVALTITNDDRKNSGSELANNPYHLFNDRARVEPVSRNSYKKYLAAFCFALVLTGGLVYYGHENNIPLLVDMSFEIFVLSSFSFMSIAHCCCRNTNSNESVVEEKPLQQNVQQRLS